MADAIGQLGLETKDFEAGVLRAQSSLQKLTTEVNTTNSAAYKFGETIGKSIVGGLKAVAGLVGLGSFATIASQMKSASEEATKLNQEIEKIGVDRSNPEFRTLTELESRLGRIDSLLGKISSGAKTGLSGYIDDAGSIVGRMMTQREFLNPMKAARDIAAEKDAQQEALMEEKARTEKNIKIKKHQQIEREDEKAFKDQIAEDNRQFAEDKAKEKKNNQEILRKDDQDFKDQIAEDNKQFAEDKKKEAEDKKKEDIESKKRLEDNQKLQFQAQQEDEAKARSDRMDSASDAISAQEKAIDRELMTRDEKRAERRTEKARAKAGRKINTRKSEAEKVAKQNEIDRPDIFDGEDPRNDGIFDSDRKPGEKARESGSAGRDKGMDKNGEDTGKAAVEKLTRIVEILDSE